MEDLFDYSMNMTRFVESNSYSAHDELMYAHAPPIPKQQLKSSNWNSCHDQSIMNQNLNLNYANPKETQNQHQHQHVIKSKNIINTTPPPNPNRDHILAERKRREKLSQRFIALSALLPGLKKMDKASVLGDAIKHLKNLQEKVKALEEQTRKQESVHVVSAVKRYDDDQVLATDQLPQVEARFSGKDVLIRVYYCEKKTGVVEQTLVEIEKLKLTIVNTTAMAFATYALDITVVAQMNEDFTMTMKDLVKILSTRLKTFILLN